MGWRLVVVVGGGAGDVGLGLYWQALRAAGAGSLVLCAGAMRGRCWWVLLVLVVLAVA